jgi:outer membrane protein assembly factor BamB
MFHHDPARTGVSTETTLGAANAPSLKVHWKVALGGKSFSSPAVVFNAALGKSVVYVGNQTGMLSAWDAATGAPVWTFQVPKTPNLSKAIQTSPAVYNGTLYFGASDHNLYALNATTGALVCKYLTPGIISSSPEVVNPDGTGPVVYFGDNGLSGTVGANHAGHVWAINAVGNPAGQCTLKWSFNAYGSPPGSQTGLAGTYDSPAFAKDQTGRPVIIFGSTDSDDAVYSVDARTGTLVWRFQTRVGIDSDVGAAPAIAPPGANGIPGGMVYIEGKDGVMYGINLTTGLRKWQLNMHALVGRTASPAQSGAVIDGNTVYYGFGAGLFALNATTGAIVWQSPAGAPVISSPAMSGAAGDKVLFVGDLSGKIVAFSAATGQPLFSLPTGAFIYSSAAVSTGQFFIAGTDANLYALGL